MQSKQSIIRALDLGLGLTKFSRSSLRQDGSLDLGSIPSFAEMTGTPSSNVERFTISSCGVQFAVGTDAITLSGGRANQYLESSFFDSPHCTALAIGALTLMDVSGDGIVDVLAVGLPAGVLGQTATVGHLRDGLTGRHNLPVLGTREHRNVVVSEIQFFSLQDAGQAALSCFRPMRGATGGKDLLIDVGHVYLSWLTRSGERTYDEHSGTIVGGVSDLVGVALQQVDVEASRDMKIRHRLDHAIRANPSSFKISGRPLLTSTFWPFLRARVVENFSNLMSSVGRLDAIENVYLTGGGAHFYLDQVRLAFPNRIRAVPHALSHFDNLRGLQMLVERKCVSRGEIV